MNCRKCFRWTKNANESPSTSHRNFELKDENLAQIHQPTWCCINWRDHTYIQVSCNPQFLFRWFICLHSFLVIKFCAVPEPIVFFVRPATPSCLLFCKIPFVHSKKDVNFKCTLNNFGQSNFCALRKVYHYWRPVYF